MTEATKQYLYLESTGALVSSTILPIPIVKEGCAVKSYPVSQKGAWNASTKGLDPEVVEEIVARRWISKNDFTALLEDSEIDHLLELRESGDKNVRIFFERMYMSDGVELLSPKVQAYFDYLVATGVITTERREVILNG